MRVCFHTLVLYIWLPFILNIFFLSWFKVLVWKVQYLGFLRDSFYWLLFFFFFLCMGYVFLFLCMHHNFSLETRHLKCHNVATLEIRFFPFPEFVVVVCLFSDFSEWIPWSLCSFLCVVTEVSASLERSLIKMLLP